MPQYCVKYRYQEKEYTAKTFACGKPNCIFDAPLDTMNVYDMTDKKVKKITLPILISALCLLAVAVILAICNVFAEIPIFLYYIFGFIGIFMILTWIIIRSPLKTKYRKQVSNDRQLVKQQALIKLLEEKGMKALTQDELKMTWKLLTKSKSRRRYFNLNAERVEKFIFTRCSRLIAFHKPNFKNKDDSKTNNLIHFDNLKKEQSF